MGDIIYMCKWYPLCGHALYTGSCLPECRRRFEEEFGIKEIKDE